MARQATLTPPGYNVRTRVHEYGGGAFCVAGTGGGGSAIYFSNFTDQRLYRQTVSASGEAGEPQPLTPEIDMRYADGEICERRNIMVCVREDHSSSWRDEAVNTIVAIDLERGGSRVLVSGASFYSSPRISPDGSSLAWLSWNHPNMPWDGCELWVAELLDDGSLGERRLVVGGVDESIFQPSWSPSGVLHFVSDCTGWWNIYRAAADFGSVEPVCEMEAEFGRPAWAFGLSTYGFASEERIICAYTQSGDWHIGDIDHDYRHADHRTDAVYRCRHSACNAKACCIHCGLAHYADVADAPRPGGQQHDAPSQQQRYRAGRRLHLARAGDRVSDRERPDRSCLLLSPDKCRVRCARRRKAAYDHHQSRGTHQRGGLVPRPCASSSGRAAALRCWM